MPWPRPRCRACIHPQAAASWLTVAQRVLKIQKDSIIYNRIRLCTGQATQLQTPVSTSMGLLGFERFAIILGVLAGSTRSRAGDNLQAESLRAA